MLLDYLKGILGQDNVTARKNSQVVLPLYLRNYQFEVISVCGQSYVFVKAKEKVNLKIYKARKNKIEELFTCPAVLVLEKSHTTQRQNLIANKIMFVEVNKQLFMPLSGIILKNENTRRREPIEKFTPQIQLCALFLLYHGESGCTAKQIAEKTKLNDMAISRGMKELEELKLVKNTSNGRTKHYAFMNSKQSYLEAIEQYAISPCGKSVWVVKQKKPQGTLRAGFSALSDCSMLADNVYETFAISKETYKEIEKSIQIEFEDILEEQDYIKLEVWRYDPLLFAKNGRVDKFSLYMSLKGQQDERTEEILKELKESILNG